MQSVGLYIHIPFCDAKCPYCDFYSLSAPSALVLDDYTDALISTISEWFSSTDAMVDTVYFGGGTPSLLGGHRISRVLNHIHAALTVAPCAEVTMEANPSHDLSETIRAFRDAGGNRLSVGMQSADAGELAALGRRHTLSDVQRTVSAAQRIGIDNISLDLMLGVPDSTVAGVCRSARIAADMGARHISAYLLKIEPNTAYGRHTPPLPDDDLTADMYLAVMNELDSLGYNQYEISNTATVGFESQHNLKYWNSDPYIGIGPAASSFWDGQRFTYARDLSLFLRGVPPQPDPETTIAIAGEEEYACLRLRLCDGVEEAGFVSRFGHPIPKTWRDRAQALPSDFVICDDRGIRLTRQGFLVSNSLIGHIFGE